MEKRAVIQEGITPTTAQESIQEDSEITKVSKEVQEGFSKLLDHPIVELPKIVSSKLGKR
jgi:hypothetical protein